MPLGAPRTVDQETCQWSKWWVGGKYRISAPSQALSFPWAWPSAIVAIENWAEVFHALWPVTWKEGGSNIGAKWGETDEVCR